MFTTCVDGVFRTDWILDRYIFLKFYFQPSQIYIFITSRLVYIQTRFFGGACARHAQGLDSAMQDEEDDWWESQEDGVRLVQSYSEGYVIWV
eukprot:SAG22_NODE_2565_length_2435_cov_1.671233_2_plen_92_part_00